MSYIYGLYALHVIVLLDRNDSNELSISAINEKRRPGEDYEDPKIRGNTNKERKRMINHD